MPSPAALSGSASQRFSTILWRLTASHQWERVLATARDWLAEEPASLQAHQAAAQALVNLRRHKDALPHLEKLLAGEPSNGFAHRLASISCFQLGLQTRADAHIQEAIRLQPLDETHWYHLALMRYKHGAHDAAARHARHALSLAPNNADTINLLALCERTAPAEQFARYRRALELEPENPVVLNNLGVYYLNVERDYTRAADLFRRALAIDPTDRLAQSNLHVVLREYDALYKLLGYPRLFFAGFSPKNFRRRTWFQKLHLVLVACFFSYALLIFYGLWLVFGLPLFKGYEALTLCDIREQAGAVGARRGGPLRFWRWPRWVRSALFVGAYVACWVAVLGWAGKYLPDDWALVWIPLLAAPVVAGHVVYAAWRGSRRFFLAWRGERSFKRAMRSAAPTPP